MALEIAATVDDRPARSRTLLIGGLLLAAPAVGDLALRFAHAGVRLMRRRRGYIKLGPDKLVIHDRWMLHTPIDIFRSEIPRARCRILDTIVG